jgi:hypothetical protein
MAEILPARLSRSPHWLVTDALQGILGMTIANDTETFRLDGGHSIFETARA